MIEEYHHLADGKIIHCAIDKFYGIHGCYGRKYEFHTNFEISNDVLLPLGIKDKLKGFLEYDIKNKYCFSVSVGKLFEENTIEDVYNLFK